MTITPFGVLPDGGVDRIVLSDGRLEVAILTYGAVIQDLRLLGSGDPRRLVLGLPTIEDYRAASPYFGVIAGRCANRIADGRFTLDGVEHRVTLNEKGRTHLHGGALGFSRKIWTIEAVDATSVTLGLVSPDGEEGYPGTVRATCRYALVPGDTGEGRLVIELGATTDAPTLVNLAAHSYFDLDDGPDISAHTLEIPAASYTPVDDRLIPTGEIAPVAGTRFDFRKPRPVHPTADDPGYDHNFVIAMERSATPRLHARLAGASSGITLEVHSTEPGLQFYDGAGLAMDRPDLDGRIAGRRAALCLEPQVFPDSPNRPNFPSAVLRTGETYRQVTEYRVFG